jgi:hypothetical protein
MKLDSHNRKGIMDTVAAALNTINNDFSKNRDLAITQKVLFLQYANKKLLKEVSKVICSFGNNQNKMSEMFPVNIRELLLDRNINICEAQDDVFLKITKEMTNCIKLSLLNSSDLKNYFDIYGLPVYYYGEFDNEESSLCVTKVGDRFKYDYGAVVDALIDDALIKLLYDTIASICKYISNPKSNDEIKDQILFGKFYEIKKIWQETGDKECLFPKDIYYINELRDYYDSKSSTNLTYLSCAWECYNLSEILNYAWRTSTKVSSLIKKKYSPKILTKKISTKRDEEIDKRRAKINKFFNMMDKCSNVILHNSDNGQIKNNKSLCIYEFNLHTHLIDARLLSLNIEQMKQRPRMTGIKNQRADYREHKKFDKYSNEKTIADDVGICSLGGICLKTYFLSSTNRGDYYNDNYIYDAMNFIEQYISQVILQFVNVTFENLSCAYPPKVKKQLLIYQWLRDYSYNQETIDYLDPRKRKKRDSDNDKFREAYNYVLSTL